MTNDERLIRLRQLQMKDVAEMHAIYASVGDGQKPNDACGSAMGREGFTLSTEVTDAILDRVEKGEAAASLQPIDPPPAKAPRVKNTKVALLHPDGKIENGDRKWAAEMRKLGLIPADCILFDSTKEAEYYKDKLLPRIPSGELEQFILQPKYELVEDFYKYGRKHQPITYSPDFLLIYSAGKKECVDVKGMETDRFILKRKMFDSKFPELPL